MSAWGARTPKRTTLWSNSRAIRKFATPGRSGRVKNAPKLTRRYRKNGVWKFQGNEKLKDSQCLSRFCGFSYMASHACTSAYMCLNLKHPRVYPRRYAQRFTKCMRLFHKEKAPMKQVIQASLIGTNTPLLCIYPEKTRSSLSCFAASGQAPPPCAITPDVFWEAEEIFGDKWRDARMWEVVKYLRGGVGLQLSEEWRESMPLKASSKSSRRSEHV